MRTTTGPERDSDRLTRPVPPDGPQAIGKIFSRTRDLVGGSWVPLVAIAGVSVVVGLLEAAVLAFVAQVAVAMVDGGSDVALTVGPVPLQTAPGPLVVAAVVFAVLRAGLQILQSWLQARVAADAMARLRRELLNAFAAAPWPVQAEDRRGEFQELEAGQVSNASGAVQSLTALIASAAVFAALLAAAVVIAPGATLGALVVVVAIFFLMRPLIGLGRRASADLVHADLDRVSAIREVTDLAEETKVFGVLDAQKDRIIELADASRRAMVRYRFAGALSGSANASLTFLVLVIVMGLLWLIQPGDLAVIGAAVLVLVRAGMYGQQIQGSYHGLHHLTPIIRLIDDAIDRYRSATIPDGTVPLSTITTIAFRKVSYRYQPDALALEDVSFEIAAGETIGVIGPSGAGKSTLNQILLRLRAPTAGAYLINGRLASDYAYDDWSRRVSFLGQDARLFRGTVAENIAFFRSFSDDALEDAARIAQVHDEIVALPQGYRTVIDQLGPTVSGGQRQRICLARALVGRPELLVLDEPTSALDLLIEDAVQQSLEALRGRLTTVIISHRLSALSLCDRIMVLVDGRLDSFAPASALVADSAFYRRALELTENP